MNTMILILTLKASYTTETGIGMNSKTNKMQ